jgi:hypothetical protein
VFGTDIEESRLSFSIKVEHPGPETYSTIGLKVWSFLKRIYEDYGDDFDWIFVSGDDTFLMVEHLRQYLATLKDEEALYLGRRWALPERAELPAWTNNLIFNLGAGYVLNRKALKLWYETCSNAYTLYESIQSGEDIAMAECLRRANVLPLDTRDKFGAERFHAFTPSQTAKIRYAQKKEQYSYESLSRITRKSLLNKVSSHVSNLNITDTIQRLGEQKTNVI